MYVCVCVCVAVYFLRRDDIQHAHARDKIRASLGLHPRLHLAVVARQAVERVNSDHLDVWPLGHDPLRSHVTRPAPNVKQQQALPPLARGRFDKGRDVGEVRKGRNPLGIVVDIGEDASGGGLARGWGELSMSLSM